MVLRNRGPRLAHFSISQYTVRDGLVREVYRVDSSHGTINEHVFHWTDDPADRRGRRRDLDDIRTEQNGGYEQLYMAQLRHYDDCIESWERRLRRWNRHRR